MYDFGRCDQSTNADCCDSGVSFGNWFLREMERLVAIWMGTGCDCQTSSRCRWLRTSVEFPAAVRAIRQAGLAIVTLLGPSPHGHPHRVLPTPAMIQSPQVFLVPATSHGNPTSHKEIRGCETSDCVAAFYEADVCVSSGLSWRWDEEEEWIEHRQMKTHESSTVNLAPNFNLAGQLCTCWADRFPSFWI